MWLQRVQQGAAQAAGKAGPDLQQFLLQIAHAARVLFFQPLLLHAAQVAQYVRSVGAVGSCRNVTVSGARAPSAVNCGLPGHRKR